MKIRASSLLPDRAGPKPASCARLEMDTDLVVYDGECPFCSNYVALLRLRELRPSLTLISAREPGIVDWAKARGFNLENGMLVRLDGIYYYGADAMWILSSLGGTSLRDRALAGLLSCRICVRTVYPMFRGIRRLTLNILGRERLLPPD